MTSPGDLDGRPPSSRYSRPAYGLRAGLPVGGADEGFGRVPGDELAALEGDGDHAEVHFAAVLGSREGDRREDSAEGLAVERVHRLGQFGGGRVVVEEW